MCPHVLFETKRLGESPLAQMTCIAKRSGNEQAAPMLYDTGLCLRSLSCMCPHVDLEPGCLGKGLLAYFTQIADNIGAAAIHNQRLNGNKNTSTATIEH